MKALVRKEITDHLESKRFFLIFALMMIAAVASLAGSISTLRSAEEEYTEFLFLKLFTTSGSAVYSFATFLAFLGPLVGIALGFDAVNNERAMGTLNRLAAQPIYRDAIVNAKFLGGAVASALVVVPTVLFFTGAGILLTGLVPEGEELARVAAFLILSCVYIWFWLALSILFSVVYRHAATSALSVIAIWLFLTLFMSLVASGIADFLYPSAQGQGMAAYDALLNNYETELALNRISPYYLFSEAAVTILSPTVRSIGVITIEQASGAISSSLSFGQSLLLVWPHLVVMAALAMAAFAGAYISFMRQEIRA